MPRRRRLCSSPRTPAVFSLRLHRSAILFSLSLSFSLSFFSTWCDTMSQLLGLAAKQVSRQATLQPRLVLPAGRTVSIEEGRRLAKLVNDEEERLASAATQLLNDGSAESPVFLEEGVSKRILLHRQRQNHKANVAAAVAYARRRQHIRKAVAPAEGDKVQAIAKKLLRQERSSDPAQTAKQRKARAGNPRKDKKKGKGTR